MSATLIINATVVTLGEVNRVYQAGAVLFEGPFVVDVGPGVELETRYPAVLRWDAAGQIVMPASICAHTHFYGTFARGLAIPGEAPKDFPEILARLWWKLDQALTLEDIRYSALVCLVDAIRNGCTTLIDHHASPNAIEGSLSTIAEAVTESKLRACLAYEVTDRGGPERALAGIAENVHWLEQVSRQARSGPETLLPLESADVDDRLIPPHLAASFGLHASMTLTDETLAACVAAVPAGTSFHVHIAEHPVDQEDSHRRSGRRVVERLARAGVLGPRSIAAHCIHIDPWEMALLRETGTWITHQPRSNMNNAVGAADISSMLRGGMPVCLGNDGFSNDMFAEMKAAYLLHKVWQGDPRVAGGWEVMSLAYTHNARLAGLFFPSAPLGEISPGALADLIFLDYHPPTPLTAENLPWHAIFGMHGGQVTTTICAGRALMRDRQLTTLDEVAIAARARELAREVWKRIL